MSKFSFNLIDPAYADIGASFGGFDFMGLLPLLVIFVAFYFFLIRPQQKKAQQQRDMLNALQKGERVVTAGGVIGTIVSIDNNQEVVLEVEGGSRLRVLRTAIADRFSPSSGKSEAVNNVRPINPIAGKTESTNKRSVQRRTSPNKTSKK